MKNLKVNKRIFEIIKRGIALLSATFVVASFSGCSKEGWKSNDSSAVSSQVAANIEAKRKQVIDDCIRECQAKGYTEEEINEEIYQRLKEKHLLTQEEIENHEKSSNKTK